MNTLTMGGGSVSLMRSQLLTESSVLDFQSTTTVDSVQQNFDMYFGVGFGVAVGATVDQSFEPTAIAVRETSLSRKQNLWRVTMGMSFASTYSNRHTRKPLCTKCAAV